MWEDGRGVRRSVYGGNASLVFSQIRHKNQWEQRRGKETHFWTFSLNSLFSPSLPSDAERRRDDWREQRDGEIKPPSHMNRCVAKQAASWKIALSTTSS